MKIFNMEGRCYNLYLLIEEVRSQTQLVLEENLDFSYLKNSVLLIISDFLSHGKKNLKYFKTLSPTLSSP